MLRLKYAVAAAILALATAAAVARCDAPPSCDATLYAHCYR